MRLPPLRPTIAGPCIRPPKWTQTGPVRGRLGVPASYGGRMPDAMQMVPGSDPSACQIHQSAEDSLAIRAKAVVDELVGDPRPEATDGPGGLLGKGPLDVEVVDVDGRGNWDLVHRELLLVEQPRPLVACKDLCRRLVRPESGVVVETPRIDVLGGEQVAIADHIGQQPVGRPARRNAIRVRRLVEGRIERVAAEMLGGGDIVPEGRRLHRELEQVVEILPARTVTEPQPELTEPPPR